MKLTDIKVTMEDVDEPPYATRFTAKVPVEYTRIITENQLDNVMSLKDVQEEIRRDFIRIIHKEELAKFYDIRNAIMEVKRCSAPRPEVVEAINQLELHINELNQALLGD